MGRSINDPKYNFIYCNCFEDKHDAELFCERLNRNLQTTSGMSDCATVFNLNDSTLSFGHEECWYHTMVRREVVSSDGKISDSTVAANDIQVDRNIGVNVSGVKLVRDLLVQATDEM